MEGREGEEGGREEGDDATRAPGQQRAERRDRADSPDHGRELAGPVGGAHPLEELADQVVQRRMHRVEPPGFPEEGPVSAQPERLQHFVEAVGEMVEAIKAHRGGQREDRSEEDPAPPVERAPVR